MGDPYNLSRFLDAQNPIYEQVCTELQTGHKEGHWIWYIFPQLRGLGHSQMAHVFGISSPLEAAAYLNHPVLGMRLRHCAQLLMFVERRSIRQILGNPDDIKLRSSMTLFKEVTPDNQVFNDVLEKYFGGEPDNLTLLRL